MTGSIRTVLAWALFLGACNSSKDVNDVVQDAGDVAQPDAADAATHDAHSATRSDSGGLAEGDAGGDLATGDAGFVTGDASMSGNDAGNTTLSTTVYVGGYGTPFAFRTYGLDRQSGALTERGAPSNVGDNPTYIAPSADYRFLYIATESDSQGGLTVASTNSTGVQKIGFQATAKGLVFTNVSPNGKYVYAASYNGGFVDAFPVQADNTVGAVVDTKQFAAPPKQSSAQTHSIRVHQHGRWAYVPNKARDEVAQYAVDATSGKLTPLASATVACSGGPRHIAFTSQGDFAYLITELTTELVAYQVNSDGALQELQRVVALQNGQGNAGAHVLVHPNDKFVYTSNRTDNSIVVFTRGTDGKVSFLQRVSTQGKRPRNFDIDASGRWLIAANQGVDGQNDGSLIVFEVGDDGKLTQRGMLVTGVGQPAAVAIVNDAR